MFSATGGIEKVCRVAGKALYEHGLENYETVRIFSMHGPRDAALENKYFPAEIFRGFGGARIKFVREAVSAGRRCDTVILSHINLLLAGWLIKKANPKVKLILIAHGIEVWQPLSSNRRMMLNCCDRVISVSSFTSEKIGALHHIPAEKRSVLNNCIDPFFQRPEVKKRDGALVKRYGLVEDDIVLLTLTRLSERDRYKGYDKVLQALAGLVKQNKKIKYLLAGGYSEKEKAFIENMIGKLELRGNVILTGYVREEELPAHFELADIYIMPSVKEGFGIVFVEAMFYGVPAIAGNADGSVDALLNGKLGLLIEPDKISAITEAISKILNNRDRYSPDHEMLMTHFSYEEYKRNWKTVFSTLPATRLN